MKNMYIFDQIPPLPRNDVWEGGILLGIKMGGGGLEIYN